MVFVQRLMMIGVSYRVVDGLCSEVDDDWGFLQGC